MQEIKIILTVGLLSVLLTGCSYYADLYIINNTKKDVVMTIEMISDISEIEKIDYQLKLKYADEILEITDDTEKQLKKKIEYDTLNSKTVSIKLPAKSTTLLGGGYNGLPNQFKEFTFQTDESIKSLTSKEMEQTVKETQGNSSSVHYTYVIE